MSYRHSSPGNSKRQYQRVVVSASGIVISMLSSYFLLVYRKIHIFQENRFGDNFQLIIALQQTFAVSPFVVVGRRNAWKLSNIRSLVSVVCVSLLRDAGTGAGDTAGSGVSVPFQMSLRDILMWLCGV